MEPGIDATKTAMKAPLSFLEVRRRLRAIDDDSDNFPNVTNITNHSKTNRSFAHPRSPEPVLSDAYVKNQMIVLQLERKQLLGMLDDLDAQPMPTPTNASNNGLNGTTASLTNGNYNGTGDDNLNGANATDNNNANATGHANNTNANASLADLDVKYYSLTDFYDQDDVTAEHLQILQELMSLLGDNADAVNNTNLNANSSYVSKAMARYFNQLETREKMEDYNDNATENVWRKMEQLGLSRVNATLQAARKREQQIQEELSSLQDRIVAARKVREDEREAAIRSHQEAVIAELNQSLAFANLEGKVAVNAALANLKVTRENNANLRADAQEHVDAILAEINGLKNNSAVSELEKQGLLRRPQAQKLESIESKIQDAGNDFANATQKREAITKELDKHKGLLEDIANVKPNRKTLDLKIQQSKADLVTNRKLQDHHRGLLLETSTAWAKLYAVAKAVGITADFNSINLVTGETQDEFFDALKTKFNIGDPEQGTISRMKASPTARQLLESEVQKNFFEMDNALANLKKFHEEGDRIIEETNVNMATAAKFDAYERRTELEKALLEQKLRHAIALEKAAQTKYHDIVNGKSSLAEHLDHELQEAKGNLAEVDKQTASAEVAAMQKVSNAQEMARQQVEDVKEHQRLLIAQEAAKEIAGSQLTNAEKQTRKEEQDALARLHVELDESHKEAGDARLAYLAVQASLKDQIQVFRDQEKRIRDIEDAELKSSLAQLKNALKAENTAVSSVQKDLVTMHTYQLKQMNKTVGAMQENAPSGFEDLGHFILNKVTALHEDVKEMAAARVHVVAQLADLRNLSDQFHERRMNNKPTLKLDLNYSRTSMENSIQTPETANDAVVREKALAEPDFEDSELLEISSLPAATPTALAAEAVRKLFPFRLITDSQSVPQSLSDLQPIIAPEKPPPNPNAPPTLEQVDDRDYPLSRLGVGRPPDRSDCPCQLTSPMAGACNCGMPKPQCGCKPLQCDCGADDCRVSSSAAVAQIIGKTATVYMYDELRSRTTKMDVPCEEMAATMSQQWSDSTHAKGECIGIGGAPILPGDFVCGYFSIEGGEGSGHGCGEEEEGCDDDESSTPMPNESGGSGMETTEQTTLKTNVTEYFTSMMDNGTTSALETELPEYTTSRPLDIETPTTTSSPEPPDTSSAPSRNATGSGEYTTTSQLSQSQLTTSGLASETTTSAEMMLTQCPECPDNDSLKKLKDVLKQAHDVWNDREIIKGGGNGGNGGNGGTNSTNGTLAEPIQGYGSKQYQDALDNLGGAILNLNRTELEQKGPKDGIRLKSKRCGQTFTSNNGLDNLVGGTFLLKSAVVSGNIGPSQHRLPVDCIESKAMPLRLEAHYPAQSNLRMGKSVIPRFAGSSVQPSAIPSFRGGSLPARHIPSTPANANAWTNSAYDRHPTFIQLATVQKRDEINAFTRAAINLGKSVADRTISDILLKAAGREGIHDDMAQKTRTNEKQKTAPNNRKMSVSKTAHDGSAENNRFQSISANVKHNLDPKPYRFGLPSVPGSELFQDTRKWVLKNDPDIRRQQIAANSPRFVSAGFGAGSWVSDEVLRKGYGGIKQKVADMIQAHADEEKAKELDKKILNVRKMARSKSNLRG